MPFFHAAAFAADRTGTPFRDPVPGAKPDPQSGAYKDEDTRPATHGSIAMTALDLTLPSDKKLADTDMAKWVKGVAYREDIAEAIRAGLAGDGWCELAKDDRDLLVARLSECLLQRGSNAMIGPVVRALNNAPESKPAMLTVVK